MTHIGSRSTATSAPAPAERTQRDGGESATVIVVDDDPRVRESVVELLRSMGIVTRAFAAAEDCRPWIDPKETACLVLDVRLPGTNGLDFHDRLTRAGIVVPVVFISAYADVRMAVRAIKAGAVDFLVKPFRDQELLDAIHHGIEQSRERRDREQASEAALRRWATLTAREREVMMQVVQGARNKTIAVALGIGEGTVKTHRGQVMLKMGAATLPDLVRLSDAIAKSSERRPTFETLPVDT